MKTDMITLPQKQQWQKQVRQAKQVTILTGAGISAESGIPTFRGPEGYWTIESKEYFPEEMATNAMFHRHPVEVWKWYLYRRNVCHQAQPNPGHKAIERLEQLLGDRFKLITQNVDGLHLRAGNRMERTYQIHGNINFMRCSQECTSAIYPLPSEIPYQPHVLEMTGPLMEVLSCPQCGAMTRPHVLWFDEYYNEEHFRFESALLTAQNTDVLLIIGTSGATTLPNRVVSTVANQGGFIVDVNSDNDPFSKVALQSGGIYLKHPSGQVLPQLVDCLSG
ncbi:Sir2 family NAD-dependent protein deacetylase [Deltaproteobacteria bacterium TL4]